MQSLDSSSVISNFIDQFTRFLKSNTNPIIITSHRQADPDALGAGILVYHLINSLSTSQVSLVFPSLSKQTERIISSFSLEELIKKDFDTNQKAGDYCIVLVDTNQPSITDLNIIFRTSDSTEVFNSFKVRIIIDHHLQSENYQCPVDFQLILTNYNSASELAYTLIKKSNITLPDETFLSIGLIGILYDTKRLVLANARVLATVSDILSGTNKAIEDYLPFLDSERDYSERLANLKSGQRNKIVILRDKYVVSLSFVSSFESSSARALQYLGSDLSAVLNRGKKEIRLSFRSTKKFYEETAIHCGELAKYIAETYSGTGSGHKTAAGCNIGITNTNNDIFKAITAYVEKNLIMNENKREEDS